MQNLPIEMTLQVESAPATDQGRKRPNNEDWVTGFEPVDSDEVRFSGSLYIVADGVGGASKGERASKYAAQKVLYQYYQYPDTPPGDRLKAIIRQAGNDIHQFAMENGTSRMATTMVAAVIRGESLTVANVGDSRGYLIRNGQITQITVDHNQADELVRNGSLTPEEAKYSKTRNKLTRSLGGESDVRVDVFKDIQLFPDDLILLCSDGLTRYATDSDLLQLCAEGNPEEIAQKLVAFANQSGGADNITVYVIEIKELGEQVSRTYSGHAPEPVDWDTIQTQSGNWNIKNKAALRKKKINPLILFGLIGMVIIFILAGSIWIALKNKTGGFPIVLTSKLTPSENTIAPALEEPTSIVTLTPSTILETTVPVNSEDILTVDEATQEILPTQDPNLTFACVHEIQNGEYISIVFDKYFPSRSYSEPYYKFLSCDFLNTNCTGPEQLIEDINNIAVGMLLKIPSVSIEDCFKEEDSYWVKVINP